MNLVEELVSLAVKVGRLQGQLEVQLVREHWTAKDHAPTAEDESPKALPAGPTSQRIIEYLDAHGAQTVKTIAAAIKANEEHVRQAVARLVKQDALIREGRLIRRRHPV